MYSLFPTPVLRVPATLKNYDPVQLEIKAAWESIQKEKDYSSTSYLYKDSDIRLADKTYDFIEKFNCVNLKNRILQAANEYLDTAGWSGMFTGDDRVVIKNSWINIADRNGFHDVHCHPGYAISGSYYFRVNEDQGAITFNNPNPMMFACEFPGGRLCPQKIDVVPDDGDILLFPSWLVHSTKKNTTDEQRIGVAFNIDLVNVVQDRVYGLNKGTHIPYVGKEISLRGLGNIK
jgi:uncharacterized protein (TIGR02466 family)